MRATIATTTVPGMMHACGMFCMLRYVGVRSVACEDVSEGLVSLSTVVSLILTSSCATLAWSGPCGHCIAPWSMLLSKELEDGAEFSDDEVMSGI